jgi:hypothetical protein
MSMASFCLFQSTYFLYDFRMLFLEGDNVAETNKVRHNFQSMVSEPIRPPHAVATMSTKKPSNTCSKMLDKSHHKIQIRKSRASVGRKLKLNESTANVESVLKTLNELYKDQFVLLDSKKLKISDNAPTKGFFVVFLWFFLLFLSETKSLKT